MPHCAHFRMTLDSLRRQLRGSWLRQTWRRGLPGLTLKDLCLGISFLCFYLFLLLIFKPIVSPSAQHVLLVLPFQAIDYILKTLHLFSHHSPSISSSEPGISFLKDTHIQNTSYLTPIYSLQLLTVDLIVDYLKHTLLAVLLPFISISHAQLHPILLHLLPSAGQLPSQAANLRRYVSISLMLPLPASMRPALCYPTLAIS